MQPMTPETHHSLLKPALEATQQVHAALAAAKARQAQLDQEYERRLRRRMICVYGLGALAALGGVGAWAACFVYAPQEALVGLVAIVATLSVVLRR